MPLLFRRLRAALVIAASFAVFWGGYALVGGLLGSFLRDSDATPSLTRFVVRFAVYGAATGLLFAGVFAVRERGRSLSSLSHVRAAIGGALAGGLLLFTSAIIGRGPSVASPSVLAMNLGVVAIMSGASAVLALAIARRDERRRVDTERAGC
jgi:hypothetical protein